MNYSVLVQKNNWLFVLKKNSMSLKYQNILIADNEDDYIELISQIDIYRYEKINGCQVGCFVKIHNTNRTIVIKQEEINGVYDFLMSVRNHIGFITKYTNVCDSVVQLS
jgi:hypothetical protein